MKQGRVGIDDRRGYDCVDIYGVISRRGKDSVVDMVMILQRRSWWYGVPR